MRCTPLGEAARRFRVWWKTGAIGPRVRWLYHRRRVFNERRMRVLGCQASIGHVLKSADMHQRRRGDSARYVARSEFFSYGMLSVTASLSLDMGSVPLVPPRVRQHKGPGWISRTLSSKKRNSHRGVRLHLQCLCKPHNLCRNGVAVFVCALMSDGHVPKGIVRGRC